MNLVQDKYGRSFKKLRVSLTDSCNLACKYCVPDGIKVEKLKGVFSDEKILIQSIESLKKHLDISKIRLTGGEPLLHKNILSIISSIKKIGFDEIAITTNGVGIDARLEALVAAGLDSVNVSLDAANSSAFESITGFDRFDQIIKALDRCGTLGLKVKLNTVVLKGQNEDEILPLLDYAMDRGIEIRFLELMKMGKMNSYFEHFYFSSQDIKNKLSEKYNVTELGRSEGSTTRYYQINDSYRFGIIENESKPFCKDCDRLRLGSDLKLYGCITSNDGIEIKDVLDDDLKMGERIQFAMNQKQDVFVGSTRSMIKVGG